MAQHSCLKGACGHRGEAHQERLVPLRRRKAQDALLGSKRAEGLQDGNPCGQDSDAGRQAGDGAGRTAGGRETTAGTAATAGRDGQPVLSATAAGHTGGARDELCAADGRLPFLA